MAAAAVTIKSRHSDRTGVFTVYTRNPFSSRSGRINILCEQIFGRRTRMRFTWIRMRFIISDLHRAGKWFSKGTIFLQDRTAPVIEWSTACLEIVLDRVGGRSGRWFFEFRCGFLNNRREQKKKKKKPLENVRPIIMVSIFSILLYCRHNSDENREVFNRFCFFFFNFRFGLTRVKLVRPKRNGRKTATRSSPWCLTAANKQKGLLSKIL